MTTYTPRVSVGMPVYNSERWIGRAIDSVLGQTYRDLELIICDNASTDGTQRIYQAYAARDQRVRYYRNSQNLGLNANYNHVFRFANGTYFKWASSNDTCDQRLIERCVEVLDARPDVVLCYGRTVLIDDSSGATEDYDDNLDLQDASACVRLHKMLRQLRLNNVMNGVIRTEALRGTARIGNYFSSDLVLIAELALRGKFVELPERLFYRRMSAETSTKFGSADRLREYYKYANMRRDASASFQHWKLGFGYLGAATRARLTAPERICVYWRVLRELVWNRHKLAADLYDALRGFFVGSRRTV